MGTRTILLLSSACCMVQCAANQCSDSVGTCNSPARASLMQTRSLKAKALSAVEAASSRTETLGGYKQYVTDLVEKYKQKHGQPDGQDLEEELNDDTSEISKAIGTILQYINAMYDDLERWHKYDVDTSASCLTDNVIQHCEDTYMSQSQIDAIDEAIEKEDKWRQSHIACRTECAKCEENHACREYHEYRKFNEEALFEKMVKCALPAPEGEDALSDGMIKTSDEDELKTMESCLEDAKAWLDPLYALYKNCGEESDFCPNCFDWCQRNQTDFEVHHCYVDIARNAHCFSFRKCYDDVLRDCAEHTCPDIEVRSKARAADNETGELIKCLLQVLKMRDVQDNDDDAAGAKTQGLAACMEPGKFATTLWDIDCVSNGPECPPVLHPCDDTVQPCGTEFMQQEYFHQGPLSHLELQEYSEVAYAGSHNMIGKCEPCGHIPQDWCPGKGDYDHLSDKALGRV